MAFKRHTENFINYRNNEIKVNSNLNYDDILGVQEEGGEILLTKRSAEIEKLKRSPPKWILRVQPIEQSIQLIKNKLSRLEELHKENLITRFSEDRQKDQEIEISTKNIINLFRTVKSDIKNLGNFKIEGHQESEMRDNIQSLLASKLRNCSNIFNRIQNRYLTTLNKREKKRRDYEEYEDIQQDDLIRYDTGFTLEQQARKDMSVERIRERENQIRKIANMTNEVAEMFEDVALMVNEQGTLFDRIDYNIESSVPAVDKGVEDIRVVVRKGGNVSKRLCFLLLAVLISGSIIVGIIANRNN